MIQIGTIYDAIPKTMTNWKDTDKVVRRSNTKSPIAKDPDTELEAPTGLRERKMQQQRQRLIDIGVDLFCSNGFDVTSIAQIIEKAELSERTFFRYFKSKEELAFDWNDKHGRFSMSILADGPKHEHPLRAMKRTLVQLADSIDADREKCVRMARLIFDSQTLESRAYFEIAKWENVFITTLQQGRLLSDEENFKLQVIVTITVNAFVVAVRNWAHAARPGKFRPWIEAALALV